MKPVLQVALDLLNADRALAIAKDAVKGGADWLEAGTPLIKSEGMDIVRQLREMFPDKIIVADMKTMDTGALETEMAAKAGADIICILAASDDGTIRDAIEDIRLEIWCETHDRSYQLTRYDTTGERGGKTRCPVPSASISASTSRCMEKNLYRSLKNSCKTHHSTGCGCRWFKQ